MKKKKKKQKKGNRHDISERCVSVKDFQDKIDSELEMNLMEKLTIQDLNYQDKDVYDAGNL